METTKIKSLRTLQPTVKMKTVVRNYGDGRIAEFSEAPDFEGPRIHLSGANSTEFWEKYPNNGYRMQMEMASRELYSKCTDDPKLCEDHNLSQKDIDDLRRGRTPEGRTWHHDHSPKDDCNMVLTDKKVHDENKHCGGSLTSNNDRMKTLIPRQKSSLVRIKNTTEFVMHKHPMALSVASGVATAGVTTALYYYGCKKTGHKPSKWGYGMCAIIGCVVSVLVHTKLNDGKIYL